jgi:hypothetical protein
MRTITLRVSDIEDCGLSAYLNLPVASPTVAPSLAWMASARLPSFQLISSDLKSGSEFPARYRGGSLQIFL